MLTILILFFGKIIASCKGLLALLDENCMFFVKKITRYIENATSYIGIPTTYILIPAPYCLDLLFGVTLL